MTIGLAPIPPTGSGWLRQAGATVLIGGTVFLGAISEGFAGLGAPDCGYDQGLPSCDGGQVPGRVGLGERLPSQERGSAFLNETVRVQIKGKCPDIGAGHK